MSGAGARSQIAILERTLSEGWVPLHWRNVPGAGELYRDAVTHHLRALRAERDLADLRSAFDNARSAFERRAAEKNRLLDLVNDIARMVAPVTPDDPQAVHICSGEDCEQEVCMLAAGIRDLLSASRTTAGEIADRGADAPEAQPANLLKSSPLDSLSSEMQRLERENAALKSEKEAALGFARSANHRASRLFGALKRAVPPEEIAALRTSLDDEQRQHALTHRGHVNASEAWFLAEERLVAAQTELATVKSLLAATQERLAQIERDEDHRKTLAR